MPDQPTQDRLPLNAGLVLDWLLAKADSPGYGRHGRMMARLAADRYAAGTPLVRHMRRLNQQWTWLCPVPDCLEMRDGYATIRACRDAWEAHAAQHEGFTAAWPAGLPQEEPVQLDLFASHAA